MNKTSKAGSGQTKAQPRAQTVKAPQPAKRTAAKAPAKTGTKAGASKAATKTSAKPVAKNVAKPRSLASAEAVAGTSATKPPRRRQEDRTREAKERLLRATIEVLVRDGYGGLTMKEVAKQAQFSSGALMHHYTNKGELVVAATAMIYEESIARGQRVAQTEDAVKAPVAGFIADCLSVYFEWPFLAAIETIVVARTDAELMKRILPVMERYRVTTDDIWMGVFRKAGFPAEAARRVLNLSLNIVRGMAINRLWRHDEKYYQAYLKEWIGIANQQLAQAAP